MCTPKILTAFATVLGALALFAQDSTLAQDAGPYGPAGSRPFLRRDLSYHAWYYDGLFGSAPDQRGYYQTGCARQNRSYNAATGYFVGYDGARHRCR